MHVFVTGATCRVGSAVVAALIDPDAGPEPVPAQAARSALALVILALIANQAVASARHTAHSRAGSPLTTAMARGFPLLCPLQECR